MTSLFVDRRDVHLEYEAGAIIFRENGQRIGTVPVAPLTRVFLRGSIQLSASLLGKLGEQGVGVVVLSGRQGKPTLMLARPHNDATRRVAQVRKSLDPDFCADVARRLLDRKLGNQIDWFEDLRERDSAARYELTHAVRVLAGFREKIAGADSLARLRGLEGSAAQAYFAGLRAAVPDSLNFSARNRRPPRDPFNALLSLTYTLIHAETAMALHGAGLDPYIGYYHQLEFGRESLASDLIEPIRPLADRFCLTLVRKQLFRAEDFSTSGAGCQMGKAARSRYYSAYEQASEGLRAAVQAEVEDIAARIGAALETPDGESRRALDGVDD